MQHSIIPEPESPHAGETELSALVPLLVRGLRAEFAELCKEAPEDDDPEMWDLAGELDALEAAFPEL